MDIRIRDERAGDAEPIHEVIVLAFRDAPHTEHTEQYIVNALREAGALTLSHVAEARGQVLGHVAISPVTISDGAAHWYGLGPISVLPEYQGRGVGAQLMKAVLAELEARQAGGCVVLGDPAYYGRFGFEVVAGLEYPDAPAEYFQALSFGGPFPQGTVSYHAAFSARD